MSKPLIYHRVEFKPADPSERLRDSIGGYPYLPKGMDYPTCSCGNRMNLYFQFDIQEEFGLPFETGSHLAVFMCEACNEQADILYDYFYTNETKAQTQDQLRANYWDFNGIQDEDGWNRFYRIMLIRPGGDSDFLAPEEFIQPCSLEFTREVETGTESQGEEPSDEDDEDEPVMKEIAVEAEPGLPGTSTNPWARRRCSRDFKVGGQPAWGGDTDPPNKLLCSCGAPMAFVCFVPNELLFPNDRTLVYTWEGVGTLFTGLCVYILACRAQCHPFAVYPVTQP